MYKLEKLVLKKKVDEKININQMKNLLGGYEGIEFQDGDDLTDLGGGNGNGNGSGCGGGGGCGW